MPSVLHAHIIFIYARACFATVEVLSRGLVSVKTEKLATADRGTAAVAASAESSSRNQQQSSSEAEEEQQRSGAARLEVGVAG